MAHELRLVERLGRWMPDHGLGRRVLVMGSWLGAEAIAYALCGAEVTAIDLDGEALRSFGRVGRPLRHVDPHGRDGRRRDDAARGPFRSGELFAGAGASSARSAAGAVGRNVATVPPGRIALDRHAEPACPLRPARHGPVFLSLAAAAVKTRLARWLRRDVPTREPGFGFQAVGLHYYLSYFSLMRILRRLGPLEVLSRYRGFADVEHYAASRRRAGRAGPLFPLKLAAMRAAMRVWNFNWMHDIRLVVRKK